MVLAAAAILAKLYDVPFENLKVLGMDLPSALVDTALLILLSYLSYSLVLNWAGDLLAFRLWYRETSVWSEFGTNMKLDKDFIRGAIPLLVKLQALEKGMEWPVDYLAMNDQMKREFSDFKVNAELYGSRLEHAGTRFSALSAFGHYYVWGHSFLIPMVLNVTAIYFIVTHGAIELPSALRGAA